MREREREREREKEREFDRQINTYVDWSGVELEGDPDFEGLADGQAVEVVHALEQAKTRQSLLCSHTKIHA